MSQLEQKIKKPTSRVIRTSSEINDHCERGASNLNDMFIKLLVQIQKKIKHLKKIIMRNNGMMTLIKKWVGTQQMGSA